MVKVSVLMPVYKTNEQYLREAIESILNQTYTDFEFLIIDDCPNDTRENIIKSYKDSRIKYFKNEKNLGISKTRNKLIDLANGEYLAVFDHDDISLPTRFQEEVKYLDEHPDVGVVGCNYKTLIKKKIYTFPVEDMDIKMSLMHFCAIMHPTSMIRKSILINNNIRYEENVSPAEDYMLWCRLIKYTKFHNINEILFNYRDHMENTTHKQRQKMRNGDVFVKNFVKNEYKDLYQNSMALFKSVIYIKLFCIIPLITIQKTNKKTSIYLFNVIPLLSIKTRIKLWKELF